MFFTNWLQKVQRGFQGNRTRRRRQVSGTPVASEVLESRRVLTDLVRFNPVVPTNVEANLTNGVLAITGTDRNDKIVVQRVDGQISIRGVRVNEDGKLVKSVAASDVHGIEINGLKGHDRIQFHESGGHREAIQINATINGGAGNDTIQSGAGNDWLRGGNGNDSITAGAGDDLIYGEAGNDTLNGGAGSDSLFGDREVVWVGGETPNVIEHNGHDVLRGSGGNDTLTGGLGDDILNGGSGVDRLVESGDVNFKLTSSRLIGQGKDSVSNIEAAELHGGNTANRLDARAFHGRVTLEGRGGNDTLIGGSDDDSLIGGWIDDLVFDGGDIAFSSTQYEAFFGILDGDDSLDGGAGNDELHGGLGSDTLQGDAGRDTLVTDHNDVLVSPDGDVLVFSDLPEPVALTIR